MLIGIDHGNKQIKSVCCSPFVSGLQQSITKPFGQSLQYRGNYYTLSNERIPFRKDKTEDDRFFILTLVAIAEELTARGGDVRDVHRVQLAVGLPPAHFGAQVEKFTAYFQGRGIVDFVYRDKQYSVSIDDVACYPQAYAAAATMLHTLVDDPKAVVLDIGGFTADYLLMKNGNADLTSCDSLENGVILLYNKIKSRGNSELDLLLDESDVDAILTGKRMKYPAKAVQLVEQLAQEFVNDLFSTLRERMLISGIARLCLWVVEQSCCVTRSKRLARLEHPYSSQISMPMQQDLNTCIALKQLVGDSYGAQKGARAVLASVQW